MRKHSKRSNAFLNNVIVRMALIGIAAICLAYVLQCAWPNGFPLRDARLNSDIEVQDISLSSSVRINEIMTSNKTALIVGNDTPDWVEIINTGNSAVSIGRWSIAKNADSSNIFTFPAQILEPMECVVIYCDGKLENNYGADYHAPFRLSAAGDTLMLFNASGTAVDAVNIPALAANMSYARDDDAQWYETNEYTPGQPNNPQNYYDSINSTVDSGVVINELMAVNKSYGINYNGKRYDYIELYNNTDSEINLSGWHMSDNVDKPLKWEFPEGSKIGPGEYLVLYASGLDTVDEYGAMHTNFSLNTDGERVILINANGEMADWVEFELLKTDIAYSRSESGWTKELTPSPGEANE